MTFHRYLIAVEHKAEKTADIYSRYLYYVNGMAPLGNLRIKQLERVQWVWLAYRRFLAYKGHSIQELRWIPTQRLVEYSWISNPNDLDIRILLLASQSSTGITVRCNGCTRALAAPEDFHEEIIRGVASNVLQAITVTVY